MGLIQRMRDSDVHFDYDVAIYTAAPPARYVGWVEPYPWGGWWAPGYGAYWYGPRVGVGLRFGRPLFGPGRWHR